MEPVSVIYTTTVITTVFTIILTIFPHLSKMRSFASDETTVPTYESQRPRRQAADRDARRSVPSLHEIQIRLNAEPERQKPQMHRHAHPHAQYWAYGSGRLYE